jgi:hypothetical protein
MKTPIIFRARVHAQKRLEDGIKNYLKFIRKYGIKKEFETLCSLQYEFLVYT